MWNMTLINQRKPWIRDVDIATDYPRKRTSSLNLVHLVWPLCGQRESLQIARPQNCVSQIFTRRGWRGRGWSNWKIIGLLCSPEECSPFLWVWYVCAKDLKRSWGWIFDSKAKANHQPGARKRNFHLPLLLMLNLAVEHKWSATWLTVWRRVEISRLPLFPDDSKVNGICLGRLCFFFYLFFFSSKKDASRDKRHVGTFVWPRVSRSFGFCDDARESRGDPRGGSGKDPLGWFHFSHSTLPGRRESLDRSWNAQP